MNQNRGLRAKIIGWMLFILAIGSFLIQMLYLYVHARFQVEYIDDRFFYIINIFCVINLACSVFLLIRLAKSIQLIGASIVIVFILVQAILLGASNMETKNITSISPDFKHVLSIKINQETGDANYYRSHYGIFARLKERIPKEIIGDLKVEWLAKDIVAITYKASDNTIQQFIGTYGDRGNGMSYYYVSAEIHGKWQGKDVEVIRNTEGITVTEDGKSQLFTWENMQQFGTLAIVLEDNNEARWTIALNENFQVDRDANDMTLGNIILYKATMENSPPILLHNN